MLISFRVTVISVVSISCLASAFSTLFVTEEEGEGRKMEATETRTQKMEGKNVAENQVIVEAIPFITNFFTKAEDVINLTPLKVATIISAQHLLDTVKNFPASGNFPQDTLNMLSNIVEKFNKTTQIIKLTAEYVNISSHYILTSLNQFAKGTCDQEAVKLMLKTINKDFLDVISKHIKVAVREINEKTEHRETTGSDVLVSSAYHIVAAFQEMTNQVMSLKTDNAKCDLPNIQTPPNSEQTDIVENKSTDAVNAPADDFKIHKQDAVHKSIKKDQALPNSKSIISFANPGYLQDTATIENIDKNPDLTIEIFPSESLIINKNDKTSRKQEAKIPESLKVAFLPETKLKTNKENKLENLFGSEGIDSKIIKKNLKTFDDVFSFQNLFPVKDLTVEILPQNVVNSDTQESSSRINKEYKQKILDNFNVYYYPLKTNDQHKKTLPNTNKDNTLKVPEDLKAHYYPENLKGQTNDDTRKEKLEQVISPFETFSLFGIPKLDGNIKQKKEYSTTKEKQSQTNFKSFDDTLTMENLNRQDLTVEVFSPEAFIDKGRDESSFETKQERMNPFGMTETKWPPKTESRPSNFQRRNPPKNHEHQNLYHKTPKIKTYDRGFASLAVDSLNYIPSKSIESEIKRLKEKKSKKANVQKGSSTVLMPWGKVTQNHFQNPFVRKSQLKHNSCDERVEPVCGIDKNKSNFIIFLNNCQRKHHNSVYKTSYEWANMDICVGFLLKYSSDGSNKYVNVIPR